jgi:predicted phage replisome organizer
MKERKYVKLRTDMYADTKFKIIDTKPERDLIHYIWTRMVTLAGKCNQEGELYMSRTIPYTVGTLAIEFNRGEVEVKGALDLLMELEMIEFTEEKVFKVKNFAKHQNIKVKEKVISDHRDNAKEVVSKSNETQEANEKEGSQNQSSSAIVKNEDIMKANINEEEILDKGNFNEGKEIKLSNIIEDAEINVNNNTDEDTSENINEVNCKDDLQEKPLKLLKIPNNSKEDEKKKTEDISVIDYEENGEEQSDGFCDGEKPLGKVEHVLWEFQASCEG